MKVFMVLFLLAAVGFAEVPATVCDGYFNPAPLSNEIDQNQPIGADYMAGFAQGDLAQSFQQTNAREWADVFRTAVEITQATTCYLVFTGNTTLGVNGALNNPYHYGWVFANPGYNPFPNNDYAFRTCYDTQVNLLRNTWAGLKVFFE